METSFTDRGDRWRAGTLLLLVAVIAAYVLAVAHGIVTIDVARDMYWAIEIAQGRALPLLGPPVGTVEVLAACWYYLGAIAIWLGGSVTAYFMVLGLLAASKYLLIYRTGLRIGDRRLAVLMLAAAAAPGVASYQLFGVGHTQFLEAAVWACVLLSLRLCQSGAELSPGAAIANAVLLGLCAALALHAHPTAILLAPWLIILFFALKRQLRATVAVAMMIGGGFVFLPFVLAQWAPGLASGSVAVNAPGVSGLGGTLSGLAPLLVNLLWRQPLAMLDTALVAVSALVTAAQVLWGALLLSAIAGALLAMRDQRWRKPLVAAVATLIAVLAATALLRDHTPFYMLYVALPPYTLLLAISWRALGRFRAVPTVIAVAVVGLHFVVVTGLLRAAQDGLVRSHLPLHSNMRDASTSQHDESVLSARTRDAVASQFLCVQPGDISLHGDVASFAMGLGHELRLHCAGRVSQVHVGGIASPWVWLPARAWAVLNIQPTVKVEGGGLAAASAVISPITPLPPIPGRNYPPRLDLMLAAAQAKPWTTSLTAGVDAVLVVSNLLPTSPAFAVQVHRDDVAQRPVLAFANTTIYRCDACSAGTTRWSVAVLGGLPETTSVVVLPSSAATLTR